MNDLNTFDSRFLHNNSKLLCTITSEQLVSDYQQYYQIDVSGYLSKTDQIELRETSTGYRFFYPLNLDGDAAFYKKLQKIDWYYMDWKWEYTVALDYIKSPVKILEIGCGNGAFLKKMKDENECVGLELNDDSKIDADRLKILNQTIEEHAQNNNGVYDWVVSFQVMEHISDIESYMFSSLQVLKAGGHVLVAVPNNDALFFKTIDFNIKDPDYKQTLLLNFPPHHMGHWKDSSLRTLAMNFNLEVVKLITQPVQPWRTALNKKLFGLKIKNKIKGFNNPYIIEIAYKIWSRLKRSYRLGDTIIVILKKK